jgi:hypothetical protein
VSHGIVHIVGTKAFTMVVPEMIVAAMHRARLYGDTSPYCFELPVA